MHVESIIGNDFSYPRRTIEFEFQRIKVFPGCQLEKGVYYSPILNCGWVCHFVSVRKILTS